MEIDPYKSVGAIKFGMSADELMCSCGDPVAISKDRAGNSLFRYDGFNITISRDGAVEVVVLPDVEVSVQGTNIFSEPSAFYSLCALDGDPLECAGTVILLNLGISMSGFHDNDESQKSVSAFARGRWDILRSKMKPFRQRL